MVRPAARWAAVGVGLSLAAAGAVVVAGPGGDRHRPGTVLGGNVPINASALSRLEAEAHNSPALTANPADPANLAVASRVDVPEFGCRLHVSADGGATWAQTPVPGRPAAGGTACFAPDAAFGADGRLHVAYTSFGPVAGHGVVPDALWVASSSDGGRTLSEPVRVTGPLAFQVRLLAERSHPGRLWLAWLQAGATSTWGLAETGAPVVVSRSDDGGTTWSAPVRVSPAHRQRVVAPVPAPAAGGGLLLAYLDLGPDRLDYSGAHEGRGGPPSGGPWELVVARSADGGSTWDETVVDDKLVPTQRFLMLFPPAPAVASGPGGDVYVSVADGRWGVADVAVWKSASAGRTWGPPVRVSDHPAGGGRSAYLPAVAVAPGGRVDVAYYDRRADPDDRRNEVSLQSSFDGGITFSPRVVLSERSFDSAVGFGADRGLPDLGSRLGLLSTDRAALAVWADTRAGDELSPKQDLARAVVAFRPQSRARSAVALGVGLGGAGLMVVLGAALAGRRGPRGQVS